MLSYKKIFNLWWPLAISWMFMALEIPTVISFVSRLPDSEQNLAAFGGITFPLALLIEAPIIMMLSAATALCTTYARFKSVWLYMMRISFVLTLLHCILLSPMLYKIVVDYFFGSPRILHDLGYHSLMIMLPWSWAIAYRRFYQGVMIQDGDSSTIGAGTLLRLAAGITGALIGVLLGNLTGAAILGMSLIFGVVVEAIYVKVKSAKSVKALKDSAMPEDEGIGFYDFAVFYIPLALSTIIILFVQPIGSAGMSRMPLPIESFALWPAITSLMWISRSLGTAMTEVVIAQYQPGENEKELWNFSFITSTIGALLLIIFSLPICSSYILGNILGFSPQLVSIGSMALLIAAPSTLLGGLISWYQGFFMVKRLTKTVTQGVLVYLVTISVMLFLSVNFLSLPGIYCAVASMSIGFLLQLFWLRRGYRKFNLDQSCQSSLSHPVPSR